jgi:hypothetical protein
MKWFRRWRRSTSPVTRFDGPWPLDTPLFWVSDHDVITIGDAFENFWIYGGTGSGKSMTIGRLVTRMMVQMGFSGLVLPVKSGELEPFRQLMASCGRADDLVIIGDGDPAGNTFNFLDDTVSQFGAFGGCTEVLVNLLEELQDLIGRVSSFRQGKGEETFWNLERKKLCRNAIDLVVFATGRLSAEHMVEVIQEAPRSLDEARSPDWQRNSFLPPMLAKAKENVGDGPAARDLQMVSDYFLRSFPGLAEKTRSIVETSLLSILDLFVRGRLFQVFGGRTTVTPREVIDQGKVLFVNLPVKEYQGIGLIAQVLIKRQFQQALERRLDPNRRPSFILMDECQSTLTPSDQQFAATSRSARCVNLYMTQSMTNVSAAFGGDEGGKSIAEALMGLGQIRVFLQNSDTATNQAAAELFGRRKQRLRSLSLQQQPQNPLLPSFLRQTPVTTAGSSEQWEYVIPPHEFTALTKPTPPDLLSEAILYHGGRRWNATGDTWIRSFFPLER